MVEVVAAWSTSQKVMSIVLVGAVPLLYFWWRSRCPPLPARDKKSIHKDFDQTIEQENPIHGKSRQIVNLFVQRLSQDPMLKDFFHPRMLKPHSLYAVILERYMLVKMGEPYVQIPIDLRQKHRNLKITKEMFDRFKALWKECEREMGLEGKDIWDDFQEEIIGTK